MLAWAEETGADYDLEIAERLWLDWFAAAVQASPPAHTAIFAQLGDLVHYDSMTSETPKHRHVLDSDSRFPKIVRVVTRAVRQAIRMLLERHQEVRVIMAPGNHDPASAVWLREGLAAQYENEPRLKVNVSPKPYFAEEWGRTALFYHHGDKRGVTNIDATLAGEFREIYGRSLYAYAHIGHLHSDEGRKTGLMYVERHETLAAKDAHAAWGGWPSGRSAKVITYSKTGGEVFRSTLRRDGSGSLCCMTCDLNLADPAISLKPRTARSGNIWAAGAATKKWCSRIGFVVSTLIARTVLRPRDGTQ